jgi:hypothetical protein
MDELTSVDTNGHPQEPVTQQSSRKARKANGHGDLPPPMSEPISPKAVSRFRIENTNFVETTREVLTTVLIVPPAKEEFIRVHPDETMKLVTFTIRSKREHYLIEPRAFSEIKAKDGEPVQRRRQFLERELVQRPKVDLTALAREVGSKRHRSRRACQSREPMPVTSTLVSSRRPHSATPPGRI